MAPRLWRKSGPCGEGRPLAPQAVGELCFPLLFPALAVRGWHEKGGERHDSTAQLRERSGHPSPLPSRLLRASARGRAPVRARLRERPARRV